MCNTPNTDPFGNVIRDCYCEAQDIAACLKQENDRIKAENDLLKEAILSLPDYLSFFREFRSRKCRSRKDYAKAAEDMVALEPRSVIWDILEII